MAIKINFDSVGNPEPLTIILANRNGNKLGQLEVDSESIDLEDKFNDASEFSFVVNKYIDGELTPLWDKLVDFKLVYCKEWDMWFEIKVELDEATETVKTVFCTQLGYAELSQIMLYDIEINTEKDIEREDYKITVLYDEFDSKSSLLNRILEKAPHYSLAHVDYTIAGIQRTFSFSDTSIVDAFQEIAEEIGCLFVLGSNSDENGMPKRTISVYDLQQRCNKCNYRGEFTDICPKCGSKDIKVGYGNDTSIFVTSDELASEGIQLVTDTDSVKNCFKLEGGDDLMTATIRNCNPNGTDYIWYFSDAVKEDMPDDLVGKIESYDIEYRRYYDNLLLSQNEAKVLTVGEDVYLNEYIELKCLNVNTDKAKAYVRNIDGDIILTARFNIGDESEYSESITFPVNDNVKTIELNEYVECRVSKSYSIPNEDRIKEYNGLIDKYGIYRDDLEQIPNFMVGYSELMNAYYNAIDLALYLESGLMPSIEMSETNAETEAGKLTSLNLSPVAVANAQNVTEPTAKSAVLAMAKILVKSTYRVQVESSSLSYDESEWKWTGNFIVTNYSDEEDTYTTGDVSVDINGDVKTFVQQKIEKALNKEDTDDLSISGLFDEETYDYDEFCAELKKYALIPLTSFHDACQTCIDILIEQGIGNENEKNNLHKELYTPYMNKLKAIESEMALRESEINIVSGVYDAEDNLIIKGVLNYIEECRNETQETLDFQNYIGEEYWNIFSSYRREDKYSNKNYISDGLNNAELFKKAQEFIEVAENEIYKSSELQYSISTTLNNLLAIPKFKPLIDSFDLGNWIRVQVDDKVYKLRLLEYGINYGELGEISVEFSDVTKIRNGFTDIQDILSQASSMATSYDSIQRQAKQGNDAQDTINEWRKKGLNSALVQIQNNDNEEVTLGKSGLLGKSYSDILGDYSPEQIKLTHNIMALTDDNWDTVKLAIGKHDYKYYDNGQLTDGTGYGISADFVTAGYVSGSQIIGGDIYSSNYSNNLGSHINLVTGEFSFGGGALKFIIDEETQKGQLIISSNEADSNVTEINENWLKTTSVYAQNLQVDSANIQGTITANHIDTITGNIGNWNIVSNGLYKTSGDYTIGMQSTTIDDDVAFYVIKNLGESTKEDVFYVKNNGEMKATAGNIAGWTIGKVQTSSGKEYLSIYREGADGYTVGMAADGADFPFFVGYKVGESTETFPFYVRKDGYLCATNAYIQGNITADEGYIGGWTIGEFRGYSAIYRDGADGYTVGMAADNALYPFFVRNDTYGTYPFYVQNDGILYATGANIEGTITATTGKIGNWNIGTGTSGNGVDSGALFADNGDYRAWIHTPGCEGTTSKWVYSIQKNGNPIFYADTEGVIFTKGGILFGDVDNSGFHLKTIRVGTCDLKTAEGTYYFDEPVPQESTVIVFLQSYGNTNSIGRVTQTGYLGFKANVLLGDDATFYYVAYAF